VFYLTVRQLIKTLETGSPRGPGALGQDTFPSKQSALQANKTAFFFRLERELEKVNSFYLQKESEVCLPVEPMLKCPAQSPFEDIIG
jgi:CDK inhibitor PHO81